MWCEQDDHPFFQSIQFAKYTFFYSIFSSKYPGSKWLEQHSILFPNQQRQPLPYFLSDSYSVVTRNYGTQHILKPYQTKKCRQRILLGFSRNLITRILRNANFWEIRFNFSKILQREHMILQLTRNDGAEFSGVTNELHAKRPSLLSDSYSLLVTIIM